MRINWFKDENNLVYINGATQLAELERTLRFPGLGLAGGRNHSTQSILQNLGRQTIHGTHDKWIFYRKI